MSKPPLRAVLPRSHARARARALYGAPFTTFHHVHLDAGAVPPMPPPRGGSSSAPTPRLTSTQSVSSPTTQSQPDALSLLFDVSAFQPGSHSAPNSSQSMFGSGATQIAGPPPPAPPPPVQNSAPAQHGARLFPLPPPSSPLPASLAALPAMNHYQQLLGSVTAGMPVPAPTKKSRAHFALESAAYGIPKHRSRGLSSGPIASSSFGASSSRTTLPDAGTDMSVQVGEDAYFLLPNALGVSDGVGGWSQRSRSQSPSSTPSGPSASALFSRRLMHFCADEISALAPLPEAWSSLPSSGATSTAPANPGHPPVPVPSQAGLLNPTAVAAPNPAPQDPQNTDLLEPIAVLQRAHARAVALSRADHSVCGSSTALLAVLLGDELRVAHLGDCALCLVRDGKMVFRSEEQQWKFNHPLQLGPFSSTVPSDSQRIALKVQPDDILILSSDGMSDNLWDEDVLDEVKKFTSQRQGSPTGAAAIIRKHAMPSMLSEALCSRAKRASEVRPQRSQDDSALPDATSGAEFGNEVPFARRAREEGIKFSGGKADDISVLVAVISSQAESTRTPKDPAPTGPPNGSSFQSNLTLLTAWSSR